jgi:hypothetical protein
MQVSITKASQMVGITRATFYRHIDKKGITIEKNEDNNPCVDVSELVRVYGHRVKPLENDTDKIKQVEQDNTSEAIDGKLTLLKEKLKHLEELRVLDKESSLNQKKQFEEQIENLQDSLKLAQEGHNKATFLLEHKQSGTGDWEKALKAMEARISNQEKAEKERAEREQKILRQNQALKKALQEEQNKGFLKRLFT